jgi:soluble lytic murein transglycosylase-like protein
LRTTRLCFITALALLALATPAPAHVAHTVQPGETLWSIAAASNLTTRTLAAANGLSEDFQVVLGSTIQIPSEQEGAAALAAAGIASAAPVAEPAAPVTTPAPQPEAPDPAGAYAVQPGDTLAGIAARSGIGAGQLAWMNGLDPAGVLLAGTVLKLPTGAPPVQEQEEQPVAAEPAVVPAAEPNPAPGQVTSAEIGSIASGHGVSPSLAAAVAWQESGFQNGVVSSANARGVMQILPGTWAWIQQRSGRQLDPNAPADNVHAGVMYLNQLLSDFGGDEATAVASYYQGAGSVRRIGLLPETQRYVANVMALRGRFGG